MARQPEVNTQGAPTEGLGQTVTFAPKLGGRSPEAQGVEFGAERTGVKQVGKGTTVPEAMMIPPAPPNKTVQLLSQIADSAMKADAERVKVEKFVGGMQRAMHGAAVAEVAAEQPWFSTLFGEADAVEGARAWTAEAKAGSITNTMVEQMDKLREMGPVEAQAYFSKTVTDNLTGDKATDSAILQSMTRALPSVMKVQAKRHYEWQQERAIAADAAATETGAKRVQLSGEQTNQDYSSPVDHAVEQDAFLVSQLPVPGMDIEQWQKRKTDQIQLMLARGQLHAVNALTRDGKNLLSQLTPDQASALTAQRHAAENRMQQQHLLGEGGDEYANILMLATDLPEGRNEKDIARAVDTYNAKYQAQTGSSIGPISPGERAALINRGYAGLVTEQRANLARIEAASKTARTAFDKARVEAEKQTAIVKAVSQNTLGSLIGTSTVTKEEADTHVTNLLNAQPTPQAKHQLLSKLYADKYVATPVSNALDGNINTAIVASGDAYVVAPPGQAPFEGPLQQAVSAFNGFYDVNPEAALAYYPKHGAMLVHMRKLVTEQGMHPAAAYKAARNPEPTSEISKSMVEQVGKQMPSGLRPETERLLRHRIGKRAEPLVVSLGEEGAVKSAISTMQATGQIEIMGGHGWTQPNKGARLLAKALEDESAAGKDDSIPRAQQGDAFDVAVRWAIYGGGDRQGQVSKSKELNIIRAPDYHGIQIFQVTTEDGVKDYFTSDDIRRLYKEKRLGISNPVPTPDVIQMPSIPGA